MPIILDEATRNDLTDQVSDVLITAINNFTEYDDRVGSSLWLDTAPAASFHTQIRHSTSLDGTWNDDFGYRLTQRVAVYLLGSRNYVASILALVRGYPTGPGVAPITRCVLEACGCVAWLLDHELAPRADARQRVARLLLDEAYELQRLHALADGLQVAGRAGVGDRYWVAWNKVTRPGVFWPSELVVDTKTGTPTNVRTEIPVAEHVRREGKKCGGRSVRRHATRVRLSVEPDASDGIRLC